MLHLFVAVATLLPLSIRPMERGDILPVARLLLRSFTPPTGYNVVQQSLIVAEHVLSLRERAANEDSNLMLVGRTDDAEIIGFVEAYVGGSGESTLPERLRQESDLGPYVASLAVDGKFRRDGVGEALMRECETRLGAASSTVTLEVEEGNAAALRLYEKLGYSIVSRDERGQRLDGDILFGRSVRVTKLRLQKQIIRDGDVACSEVSERANA